MSGNLKQATAFLGALMIGTLLLFAGGQHQPGYLLPYAMIMLVGLILAWNLSSVFKGEVPWYSPHIAVLGFFFLIEFAAPVAVVLMNFESKVFRRPLLPEELFPATIVALIGVSAYLIGWRLGPKGHSLHPTLHRAVTDSHALVRIAPIVGLLFFILSIFAWAYMYRSVGGISVHVENMGGGRREAVTMSGGYIWHIARFGYAGVLLYFAVKGPKSILLWIMMGIFTVILAAFGSRSYLVILLLGALIVYRMRFTHRTPITLIVVSGVVLFIVATFLVQLRATGGHIGDAKVIYLDFLNHVDTFVYLILGHMTFIIQRSELIYHLSETGDYQFGKTYLNLLQIIPGLVWPSKYEVLPLTGGQYYVETFFPRRIGKISLSNNIFTEMYLNFAWPGVVVGGFIFGYAIRWVHSRLIVPAGRYNSIIPTVAVAICAMSWFRLMKSGSGVLLAMFYLLFPLMVLMVINLLFSREIPTEHRQSER